jgi:hypothetical protein
MARQGLYSVMKKNRRISVIIIAICSALIKESLVGEILMIG